MNKREQMYLRSMKGKRAMLHYYALKRGELKKKTLLQRILNKLFNI